MANPKKPDFSYWNEHNWEIREQKIREDEAFMDSNPSVEDMVNSEVAWYVFTTSGGKHSGEA